MFVCFVLEMKETYTYAANQSSEVKADRKQRKYKMRKRERKKNQNKNQITYESPKAMSELEK